MPEPEGYLLDRAAVESLRRQMHSLRHMVRNLAVRKRRAHRGSSDGGGRATRLKCTVKEPLHVTSADDSFVVDNVVALNGTFADDEITDVDNIDYDNHHFDNAPLELVLDQDDEKWRVSYDGSAKILQATIKEPLDVAAGDADFTADNLVAVHGYCGIAAATEITVTNTFGFAGDDNGKVWINMNSDGTYECIQMECPT